MKILVNYDLREKGYLSVLTYHLKKRQLEAVATSTDLQLSELLEKARHHNCDGIFLVNEQTLKHCVPGSKPTLDSYRGSRLDFSIPVIVGNSLPQINTVDHGAFILGNDLDKFKYIKFPRQKFPWSVLDTVEKMQQAVENIKQNAILIAYDIETKTFGLDEENRIAGDTLITCCTWTCLLKDMSIVTYVLPIIDFGTDHWTTKEEYSYAIQTLREINRTNIPKVMHNGKYDCLHSIVYNAEPHNWILDTMALAYSQYATLPKTLDFVSSICLPDYIQWKEQATEATKNKDIQSYWAYNATDGINTLRICLHYLNNLPAYAKKNYQTLFKLVYPALYCDFEGILIDQNKQDEDRKKEEEKLEKNLNELRIMTANEDFNPSSPKQVQLYVYDIFGASDPHVGKKKDAETGKKTKKVKGTDEKNLKSVGEQHPILLRFTNAIIAYREARKAISTYFNFIKRNQRLLYCINPFGETETGRMSATKSSFWCGTQVQNIPGYAKGQCVADEGFILEEIDKSQSEARCTAYLSQDLNLMAALEHPTKDFYKTLGTLFFQMDYDTVTKDFRNKVLKKIVHGTNYKMGAATFVENAGTENLIYGASVLNVKITMASKTKNPDEITVKDFAHQLLEAYHKPFYRVRGWYDEVKAEIRTTHMLVSPLGYTRYFFGDIDKKYQIWSSAIAHGPQNLSVSILNIGFWNTWQLVKKYKGALRLKAQIHDSILYQRAKDREDIRMEMLKAVNTSVIVKGRKLTIPNDIKVGTCWGTMEELPRISVGENNA